MNATSTVSVMILGAGLATRLRPLTDTVPKPLVPVGDRPAIEHILEVLVRAGFTDVVVNAHHAAEALASYEPRQKVRLRVSFERELLGTAGGVHAARTLLGEGDVLVWNGDILCPLDAQALVRAHRGARDEGAKATLAFVPASRGNIGIDAAGRVVRLRQETVAPGEVRAGDFLPVHVMGSEVRDFLPPMGCLVGDVYLPLLRQGARLASFEVPQGFRTFGTLAEYLDANLAWLDDQGRASWVHPDADLDPEVTVQRAIVGAHAKAAGRVTLSEVVVWPGARVTAGRKRAIAMGDRWIDVGNTAF